MDKVYTDKCPTCGMQRVFQQTSTPTAHGLQDRPWWRCDNCGLTYQIAPYTDKLRKKK